MMMGRLHVVVIAGVAVASLLVAGFACKLVGKTCTLMDCLSGVTLSAHLDVPAAALEGATGRACYEEACVELSFQSPAGAGPTCSFPRGAAPTFGCNVALEPSGARLELHLAPPKASVRPSDFAEGDRVSVRIELPDGGVFEKARRVVYRDNAINGEGCEPVCRVARVELYRTSETDALCEHDGCQPGATFETKLPQKSVSGETTLVACKGERCATDRLPPPSPDGPSAAVRFSTLVAGDGLRLGSVEASTGEPYGVKVRFEGERRDFQDGDRYRITWSAPDGTVLYAFDEAVTYEVKAPGGTACDPYACRVLTVSR